jgi:hypothetical protein
LDKAQLLYTNCADACMAACLSTIIEIE